MKKFKTGALYSTPAALKTILESGLTPFDLLRRHSRGDWGDLTEFDLQANEEALKTGERLLSAYNLPDGERIWIITEWDRSATTLLLPREY